MMAIPDHARTNFQTLLRAAAGGALALIECNDAVTHEPRYVICAVGCDRGDYAMTPFGHLADGNPFEAYLPPDVPGGPQSSADAVADDGDRSTTSRKPARRAS
jgi:hypothetical protein